MALLALCKYRSAFVYATWNPLDKGSNILLQTGNLVAYQDATSGSQTVRSTNACVGKTYFEMDLTTLNSSGASLGAGVADASTSLSTYAGSTTSGVELWLPSGGVYFNGAVVITGTSHGNGTYRYGYAVDVPTRKIWILDVTTGAWVGGGDPTLGTSPTVTLAGTGALFAACTPFSNSPTQAITLISNPASMTGTIPSGFTAGL